MLRIAVGPGGSSDSGSVEVEGGHPQRVSTPGADVSLLQLMQDFPAGMTVEVSVACGDGREGRRDGSQKRRSGGGVAAVVADFQEVGVEIAARFHALFAGGLGVAFEQCCGVGVAHL